MKDNLEKKLENYKKAVLQLTELLDNIKIKIEQYGRKYAEYKEKKFLLEKEALSLKEKKILKTLKDVDFFIVSKLLDTKKELVDLENELKVLQLEKEKLKYIVEFEKTSLLLERSLEKEDNYIPGDNFNS